MIKLIKISVVLFVGILILAESALAFTPDKEIWYWTSYNWNHNVAYCSPANIELIIKPGGIGYNEARGHLNTARNQWIFIPTTENTSQPTTITVYDGSRAELEKLVK